MSETTGRRRPKLIEEGLERLPPAPASAAEAPPVDDAPPPPPLRAGRRGLSLAGLFWAGLGGLLTFALGLWAYEVVEALIARNLWLGRAALGLAVLAGAAALLIALREIAGLARLGRIDALRTRAAAARQGRDRAAAAAALEGLSAFLSGRPELAAARAEAKARAADLMDADAVLDLGERRLLAPLDAAAEQAVKRGAREAATATALIPLPALDVLIAFAINLRMIRRVAEIYGGRSGWAGSLRLMRAVAAHLAATGLIALGDDLLGPTLGGGALAKLSRRFGEGAANGAMTARIGIAAMEVCRPLPFVARAAPRVPALMAGALQGFLRRGEGEDR